MKKRLLTGVLAVALFASGCSQGITQEEYDVLSTERDSLTEQVGELEQSAEELRQTNKVLEEQSVMLPQKQKAIMVIQGIQYEVPASWKTLISSKAENTVSHIPENGTALGVVAMDCSETLTEPLTEPGNEELIEQIVKGVYHGISSNFTNMEETKYEYAKNQNGDTFLSAEVYSDTEDGRVKDLVYIFVRGTDGYVFELRSAKDGVYDEAYWEVIESITERNWNQQAGVADSEAEDSAASVDNDPTMTLSEYNQIENGMSYEKVVEIVGSSGTEMATSSVSGYTVSIYSWDGNGIIGSNANITFTNGEVSGKAQLGLQ